MDNWFAGDTGFDGDVPEMIKRVFIILFLAAPANATTFYISPNGNNANSGLTAALAKKTFVNVFAAMTAADELVVMSTATITTYTGAVTGYMSWDDGSCANCEQAPSGTNAAAMTIVRSTDVTKSIYVDGGSREGLFVGRSTRKDKFIKVEGLTFKGGGNLYNTKHIYLKTCGFYEARQDQSGSLGIGTNDGNWGNMENLVEDCWIWGKDRGIASNYRGTANIWRRVFIRGDGCNVAGCAGSGNPNIGFTLYNSSVCQVQNVLQVDRTLDGGEPYADFASAQHDPGPGSLGSQEYSKQNKWLGSLSLNSEDTGFNFECDGCTSPSVTMKDDAAVLVHGGGFNIGAANAGVSLSNLTALNITLAGESGFRVAPGVTGAIFNVVSATVTQWGVNSAVTPSYVDVFNSGVDDYNQTTCAVGCLSSNPRNDGTPTSIKYVPRIETGSALKGTGSGGADYGANIVNAYGVDGTFAGDASSETLTGNSLWPWPNEARIKSETCGGIATGWCAGSKTLSQYVWDFLGNTDGPYGSNPASGFVQAPKISSKGSMTFKNVRLR